MKINQLFREKVTDDILNKMLEAYNLKGLDDDTTFSKHDLVKNGTVRKMAPIRDQLLQFYLPCKSRIYLENMDENKYITVLRQVLKLFQVKIESKQKYIKNKKTTIYSIVKRKESPLASLKVDQATRLLFFNG